MILAPTRLMQKRNARTGHIFARAKCGPYVTRCHTHSCWRGSLCLCLFHLDVSRVALGALDGLSHCEPTRGPSHCEPTKRPSLNEGLLLEEDHVLVGAALLGLGLEQDLDAIESPLDLPGPSGLDALLREDALELISGVGVEDVGVLRLSSNKINLPVKNFGTKGVRSRAGKLFEVPLFTRQSRKVYR